MMIDCRIATEADADEIAALVNRAYRPVASAQGWTHEAHLVAGDRISPEQVRALLYTRPSILVLCQDSVIVACVHVHGDASVVWIGMLATEPALQSCGLGKLMLEHAETYAAKELKADSALISVLSPRHELIDFYQRRGYSLNGKVTNYPATEGIGQPIHSGLKVVGLVKHNLLNPASGHRSTSSCHLSTLTSLR